MQIPKQKTKKIADSKGFSFIESMLAVAVMTTGIIAAMQLFTAGIRQSMESRSQTIGAMLAQEGAEMVQNFRDNNWAARNTRTAFDSSAFPAGSSVENCRVFYLSPGLLDCNNGSDHKKLYLDGSNHYVFDSGTPTKFERKVMIYYQASDGSSTTRDDAQKAEVVSVVSWGNFLPGSPINDATCNTSNNCAYSRTILSRWAE